MQRAKINRLNAEFEDFLDSQKVDETNTELNASATEQRRKEAEKGELDFCRVYFPNIFNEPFNDVHKHIASLTTGDHTVSGHRYSGKSTIGYVTKIIRNLAKGLGGILNVSLRTQENAVERNAALIRLMRRNTKLMYDYKVNIQQDNKNHYIINNTHLIPSSYKIGLRSIMDDEFKRIQVSICDDLYNKDSVTSERDNEKVKNFFTAEVKGQMEPGGLSIFFGNMISENCPLALVKKEFPDNHFSFPALNEKGETNWKGHSLFTTDYWNKFKLTIPFDVWEGEYQCNPGTKGEVFEIDWLSSININHLQALASVSYFDAAHGQSPAACNKAIATLTKFSNDETVITDMYVRKESYQEAFQYAYEIQRKVKAWKMLLFENDFGQWNTAQPYYEAWQQASKAVIPLWLIDAKSLSSQFHSSDKESRILSLVFPFQKQKVKISDHLMSGAGKTGVFHTEDMNQWKKSYLGFGSGLAKIDAIDATAGAYICLPWYIERGTFRPLKERRFANKRLFSR